MRIVPYNPYHQYVSKFLTYRSMEGKLATELPENGWVALEGEIPVAFGFFRIVEGGSVILDSLITNPESPAKLRNYALNRLVAKMIKVAKHYNVKGILAFTTDDNTLVRSTKHGFSPLPHQVINLSL